jgi:hypothetical protein
MKGDLTAFQKAKLLQGFLKGQNFFVAKENEEKAYNES